MIMGSASEVFASLGFVPIQIRPSSFTFLGRHRRQPDVFTESSQSIDTHEPATRPHEPMPSAFHTFKLVPMANRQPAPILPPSTPGAPRPMSQPNQQDNGNSTPTSESRMNPPPLPRSLMTPARDVREGSVTSSVGGSARKPRQNLEERDHILMVKHCYEQRHNFKEGTKAQFWTGVNTAFQQDTGKILAQMSATVARLVEARRRQIADYESGVIPQKPGGELNDRLDQWMEFLRTEDGDAEAERMRQVDARRRVEEARKEARRAAIAAETLVHAQNQGVGGIAPHPQPTAEMGQHPHEDGEMIQANGQVDMNGYNPRKRKRTNERELARQLQAQIQQQQEAAWAYQQAHPPEPPKRVVVEGALTKHDWMEIMGNDARLRALENKVDKIELICSQNNKLLLQLVQNQSKERTQDEERVPVHLDAEFERDYL
jgi:hypothetical protein